MADLRAFGPTLLGRLRVEALVHGNATPAEAVAAARAVVAALGEPKALFAARPSSPARVVELPPAASCLYQARGPNPGDKNSAVEVIFQAGVEYGPGADAAGRYHEAARCMLLMHLAKEPCFDELRTKQQLGYMVFSGLLTSGDEHVLSLRFIVQSEVRGPGHLDGRVEAFLVNLRAALAGGEGGLGDDDFAANRAAVAEKLLEKDKNLNEETNYHWAKVLNGSCDFGRRGAVAAAVAALGRADVLAAFDAHLALASPTRRKLSVQVGPCARGPFSKQIFMYSILF